MASSPKAKAEPVDVVSPTGVPLDPTGEGSKEEEVDFTKDAPAERPYAEAITDGHRESLAGEGVIVE